MRRIDRIRKKNATELIFYIAEELGIEHFLTESIFKAIRNLLLKEKKNENS